MQLPPVQSWVGGKVADALGQKLGTRVAIGRVNLGLLGRLIVDDLQVCDQRGERMLAASRVSVSIDLLALGEGKTVVTSAQLFGLKAKLYRQTADAPLNIQFAIDSLASKDTTRHTPLDLHIGSLIIRHGQLSYDQQDAVYNKGIFSAKHIALSNLSAHIVVNRLTDSLLDASVKKLAFREQSGLQLDGLSFKLYADHTRAKLEDFRLLMPHTDLSLGQLAASYRMLGKDIDPLTLQYAGSVLQSKVTPADLSPLLPLLGRFGQSLYLAASFSGTGSSLRVNDFSMRAGNGEVNIAASGSVSDWNGRHRWKCNMENLSLTQDGMVFVSDIIALYAKVPQELLRLGNLHCEGTAWGDCSSLAAEGKLETGAGNLGLQLRKRGDALQAQAKAMSIDVGKILDNKKIGSVDATLSLNGKKDRMHLKGDVSRLVWNGYPFRGILMDGHYTKDIVEGTLSACDPNASFNATGLYAVRSKRYRLDARLDRLVPSILGLKTADRSYALGDITLSANNLEGDAWLDLTAPFADVHLRGDYNFATLAQGVVNMVAGQLPSLPGVKAKEGEKTNDFTLQANILSAEPLNALLGIPLHISSPVHIKGSMAEARGDISLVASVPELAYGETYFHAGDVVLTSEDGALNLSASLSQGKKGASAPSYRLHAKCANDRIATLLHYDNHSQSLPIKGKLNFDTQFYTAARGKTGVSVAFQPSELAIGDSLWQVHPSSVRYEKDLLQVDGFSVSHGDQHVSINGKATTSPQDSIIAELGDVNVAYILNLVNFHSVDFAGRASGQAVIKSLLSHPEAYALLDVEDFIFEGGPLGTLHAQATYDTQQGQIDIQAVAEDGPDHTTLIDGYVSPTKNYIDLGIEARETNLKFMESFCGSFMSDVRAWAKGKVNLVGDLSDINLVGDIHAHGSMHMKQLGTDYTFSHLHAHAIPDDIQIQGDTIYDRNHHTAIISGGIHHRHLTRLSYDLDVKARNFLGYDTHEFGENTFYGTIYATGQVGIHGRSGETVIDIDAAPEKGSIFVYNAASPDAISDKSFIHWNDITPSARYYYTEQSAEPQEDQDRLSSDMRINFLINTNENLTLKLIMDPQSGDYITLYGNGVLRANYFDKGSFDMFGNYIVSGGTYKLTIQNLIKKDFEFMPGGTIAFGGNPYSAPLNLEAKYVVNGVPLSDLSIGQSFSSNNIRVDCLMDITGTPGSPKVSFAMDMPTVGTDVKQMIYSVINSQEEMNQQVLYLLAIGRFYAQTKNNQASSGSGDQQSQTSLALQSLLSGTVSQQLNSVLSSLIKTNNWNVGANISTGDEGLYNAEYEGILNGRMLNNRLLFNGQFGYRDNPNATQSFIGDFDLRYLIFPSGNLAVRMYNQANDRYFTRNSLNTQGIGLIMKKDFNGIGDLLGIKKKNVKKKAKRKKTK